MLRKRIKALIPLALLAAFAAGCEDDDGITGIDEDVPLRGAFTMSNETNGNEVIFFRRGDNGTLTEAGRFNTGGTGTGESIIGSAHPIQITEDRRFLLVVNAGSDELTAFRITENGLQRTDVVPSGGKKPVSVTIRRDGLVFVLNLNGGEGGIAGFRLSNTGDLTPIPNSQRQLSGDTIMPPALPPQVEFSPDGNVLVVTERFSGPNNEGRILTFTVGSNGLLSQPIIHPPFGDTPFGMDFTPDGILIVSEAFVKAPGVNPEKQEGKASSFRVLPNGAIEVISRSVPTQGSISCWVQPSADGRFAWVTNFGKTSNSITTFRVGRDGTLTRLNVTPTGDGPIGMGLTVGGDFLYNLNARDGSITAFRVDKSTGNLTKIQLLDFSPNSAFGLIAL